MKKLKYIITSVLMLNLSIQQTHPEVLTFTDFESIKQKSLYRLMLLPTLFGFITYLHTNKIKEAITDHPVSSSLLLYMIGSYIIDSYFEYKKVNQILTILKSSEKINGYLLCAIILKKDRFIFKNSPNTITTQLIAAKIYEYSGFQIDEIENITTTLNKKALEYLSKFDAVHFDFQFTDLEKIITQENFSLDDIIPLFQKDSELYQELLALQKNEHANIDTIFQLIGFKIKNEIQALLKIV